MQKALAQMNIQLANVISDVVEKRRRDGNRPVDKFATAVGEAVLFHRCQLSLERGRIDLARGRQLFKFRVVETGIGEDGATTRTEHDRFAIAYLALETERLNAGQFGDAKAPVALAHEQCNGFARGLPHAPKHRLRDTRYIECGSPCIRQSGDCPLAESAPAHRPRR
jgi:hypothetical protein